MNTLEILTLYWKKHLHSRPVLNGVYARNRLPRLLNVPSALVGNTDPDHQMGQHWIAIYIDASSRGEYYDPTGRPPHESAYVNFMNKHCLHWTYNTVRGQEEGSTMRGFHCICHFIHRCAGHTMTDVTRLLGNAMKATGIVQRCVLLLAKHVLWKKKNRKKRRKKRRLMQPLYRASHKPGPSTGWLRGSNVPFHSFSRNTTVRTQTW